MHSAKYSGSILTTRDNTFSEALYTKCYFEDLSALEANIRNIGMPCHANQREFDFYSYVNERCKPVNENCFRYNVTRLIGKDEFN